MPRPILFALLFGLALLPASFSASAATASPPDLMSYQGYLVDVNGAALAPSAPANYPIVFRIYDASTGGNILWAEQQIVTVDKGNFSVVLGEGTAVSGEARPALSSAFVGADASERYLGITVTISGTTMTISPRLRLLPSPYAFTATKAMTALSLETGGGTISAGTTTSALVLNGGGGNVGIGTASPATLLQVGKGDNALVGGVLINTGWIDANQARPLDVQVRGDSKLTVTSTGNVGIGLNNPDHKLTVVGPDPVAAFSSTGGNAYIRVWDNTGFNNRIEFASRGNGRAAIWTGGDHFNVLQNGNVGIGTTTPAAKLHINGSARIEGQNTLEFGGGISPKELNNGKIGYQTFSSGLDIVGAGTAANSSDRRITLHAQGGIQVFGGFNINGSPFRRTGGYGYLTGNGSVGAVGSLTIDYAILSDGRIACPEFNAFSDTRIKNVVGLSDSRRDLETIQKLRVTDYRMVDKVAEGDGIKKGFIAQEVEAVIPEAVSLSSQFVPDIYSKAVSCKFDEEHHALNVALAKPHGLKIGDQVRIITDDSTLESEVTNVPSKSEFVVGNVKTAPNQAFVYGKKVSDFRTLNYDRVFTTGIGAIQELARQVEALKQSEARVAELEKKAVKVDALEQQVAKLQKLVADLASATRNSATTVAKVSPTESLATTADRQ